MIITGSFYADILEHQLDDNQSSNEEPVRIVLVVSKAGSNCCRSPESTAEDKVKERKDCKFCCIDKTCKNNLTLTQHNKNVH